MLIRINHILPAVVVYNLVWSIQSFSNRKVLSKSRLLVPSSYQLTHILQASNNPLVDIFSKMNRMIKDENRRSMNESTLEIPEWDQIRSMLEAKQTDEEKSFRSNLAKGLGKASPLNAIRLFDEEAKEEDIRVIFYRDHASWCECPFIEITFKMVHITHRTPLL